jgi:hypothetical protein
MAVLIGRERQSAWWGVGTLAALCLNMPAASAQFTAYSHINVGATLGEAVPKATETDYVPHVCNCENGAASFEALKAQAVAARTFAYYKMNGQNFIRNGTVDQVYSCSSNPTSLHYAAAAATEGEILYIHDNIGPTQGPVLIAAFYVAGAKPQSPFDPENPSARATSRDPDPTNTQRYVTYPYENDLWGGDNPGTSLGFIGTPTNPNWPNRGAKSQNGADYLSDNGISYVDILKYYYGADIQLRTASTAGTGVTYSLKTLTNFDDYGDRAGNVFSGHEGYFNRSPTFSGSTTANVAGSTAERTSAEKRSGSHSQRIDITYDESSGTPFFLRHVAAARFSDFGGSSNVATQVANLQFESSGSVGFWMKTFTEGLTVSIAIDDPTTGDRGIFQTLIADGEWHRYEWFIDRADDWEPWPGVGGNGQIDGELISIDSIQIAGSSDAVVWLDDVFWNPQASFSPRFRGDFNGDGQVDAADYAVWRNSLGQVGTGLAADANDDGAITAADYSIWKSHFGTTVGASLSATSAMIPEPAGWFVTVLAASTLAVCRKRNRT